MSKETRTEIKELRATWLAKWDEALSAWSRFTKLSPPRFCLTATEEKAEGLTGSFAMIRLLDHAVVISLRQVEEMGLQDFPVEVLAHEVGHHVYAPADLRDNARLIARIRRGLPGVEDAAPLVSNLYTDLLINDRLQRGASLGMTGLDMAGLYKAIRSPGESRLWALYMRMYEALWNLEPGSLVSLKFDERLKSDAQLGARVIRAYASDWLGGAGRFAALLLPYIEEEAKGMKPGFIRIPWLDAGQAGVGGEIPDGLSEIDGDEIGGAIHPSEDSNLTGLGTSDDERPSDTEGRETVGGQKHHYRDPAQYIELMRSVGVELPEEDLVARYYRERARPYIVPFPQRETVEAQDPLPEGLDPWEVSSPLSEVDWMESIVRSPVVIPGVTTVQRAYGTTEGTNPERDPVDIYFGVDCSGSMANPKISMSYPVLAGTIIALSAFRAGARVMACLSGEPGEHTDTGDFVRDERKVLLVLTGYLGTGYAFGILRLKETFLDGNRLKRPAHILIVTDSDFFYMLKEIKTGWEIAQESVLVAGGGATLVLNLRGPQGYEQEVERLKGFGWEIHYIVRWEDIVPFARAFSQKEYGKEDIEPRRRKGRNEK